MGSMSLVMLLTFIVVAIIGRVIFQYRLTGDHGIRTTKSTSSGIEKIPTSLIIIAFLGATVISALFVFVGFSLDLKFDIYGQISRIILCMVGIVLTSISQIQMGENWRIGGASVLPLPPIIP